MQEKSSFYGIFVLWLCASQERPWIVNKHIKCSFFWLRHFHEEACGADVNRSVAPNWYLSYQMYKYYFFRASGTKCVSWGREEQNKQCILCYSGNHNEITRSLCLILKMLASLTYSLVVLSISSEKGHPDYISNYSSWNKRIFIYKWNIHKIPEKSHRIVTLYVRYWFVFSCFFKSAFVFNCLCICV